MKMKKVELEGMIADLNEKAEQQKSEIIRGLHALKAAIRPKNIAKRAAFSMLSKVRSIFRVRKKHLKVNNG